MLAMQRRQPPADVQPQPEQGGKLRVCQVGVEVAGDVEERLLDDIRCVEPGSKPRVEAQLHHVPEAVAMLVEERCQRLLVAAAELLDRVIRVARRLVSEGPHTLYPPVGNRDRKMGIGAFSCSRRALNASCMRARVGWCFVTA